MSPLLDLKCPISKTFKLLKVLFGVVIYIYLYIYLYISIYIYIYIYIYR